MCLLNSCYEAKQIPVEGPGSSPHTLRGLTSQPRGSSGSALQKLAFTTSMGGRMAWIPLASTDCDTAAEDLYATPLEAKQHLHRYYIHASSRAHSSHAQSFATQTSR